jgi:hypothetical protein
MEETMIGHSKAQAPFNAPNCSEQQSRRLKLQNLLDLSQVQSRHLWELLLFLLVSMAALALRNHNLHESFSEGVRQLLGCPLSATLLSAVLGLYGFSTLTLLLSRGGGETRLVKRLFHFSFRTVFYLFYGFSGVLAAHYLFVFSLGLVLYLCEQLGSWLTLGRIEPHDGELLEEP